MLTALKNWLMGFLPEIEVTLYCEQCLGPLFPESIEMRHGTHRSLGITPCENCLHEEWEQGYEHGFEQRPPQAAGGEK